MNPLKQSLDRKEVTWGFFDTEKVRNIETQPGGGKQETDEKFVRPEAKVYLPRFAGQWYSIDSQEELELSDLASLDDNTFQITKKWRESGKKVKEKKRKKENGLGG